jgi:hypothetical protein
VILDIIIFWIAICVGFVLGAAWINAFAPCGEKERT